mmetsp:Transcript_8399/g.25425  ORF Transcript_8399/g.25425 Transcript_8399/m.25425 type:complete len:416 (+) Transcript_8399:623-1870(+)
MSTLLQIDPNFPPPFPHAEDGVVLRELHLFPPPRGNEPVPPQAFSQFTIGLPHDRLHRGVVEFSHGHDRLGNPNDADRAPLTLARLLDGVGRGGGECGRRRVGPGRSEGEGPRHVFVRGVGRFHLHEGGSEGIHALGKGAQTAEPLVPPIVRQLHPGIRGIFPHLVPVPPPQQRIRQLRGGRRRLEPPGGQLSQEIADGPGGVDGPEPSPRFRNDVDRIPIVGLTDDADPDRGRRGGRRDLVFGHARESGRRTPRQYLRGQPERPSGDDVRYYGAVVVVVVQFSPLDAVQDDSRILEEKFSEQRSRREHIDVVLILIDSRESRHGIDERYVRGVIFPSHRIEERDVFPLEHSLEFRYRVGQGRGGGGGGDGGRRGGGGGLLGGGRAHRQNHARSAAAAAVCEVAAQTSTTRGETP